jgi:hypothetical protein
MKNNGQNEMRDMITGLLGELEPIVGSINGIAVGLAQESAKTLLAANAEALGDVVEALRADLRTLAAPAPKARKAKAPASDPRQIEIPGAAPVKAKRGRPRKNSAPEAAPEGSA